MTINHVTSIILEHSEILIRKDKIIQINSIDKTYTVEDIKDIHSAINELTNKEKSLLLLITSDFTSVDVDARNFMTTPEANNHFIAKAYVIKSLAQRLILNFLIKVKGTPIPIKFFTETTPAIKWLKSFKSSQILNT